MTGIWQITLLRKYGSLLDLVEMHIRNCPDELWEESVWPVTKDQPWVWPLKRFGQKAYPDEAEQLALLPVISAFWNVAYHLVFHIDFYLSGGNLPYRPPAPFREEEHRPNTVPARTYRPEELIAYVDHCRTKAREVLGGMTDERAAQLLPRTGSTYADLLLHNLVHAHEHVGQLGLFLGQHGIDSSPSLADQLRDGIRERDDPEVDHWVATYGGYGRMLPQVVAGLARSIRPGAQGVMVWDAGSPFAIAVSAKGTKVLKDIPAEPDVTVRLSKQDFLRVMTRHLDFQEAVAAGRIQVEGDGALLTAALSNRR